ncbi:hypothetical protein CYMTET_42594 [Cymbomonas tetramitiformis]|uniref:Uncharacterized protein n=1 Tax=Cymbomonas tetramitiformis TaxID=36881 RepID=A0AAE0C3Y5_9CHLO|nr:hypothetical protein CYMTET_42594 [Cymbomonas tetramitiformis]
MKLGRYARGHRDRLVKVESECDRPYDADDDDRDTGEYEEVNKNDDDERYAAVLKLFFTIVLTTSVAAIALTFCFYNHTRNPSKTAPGAPETPGAPGAPWASGASDEARARLHRQLNDFRQEKYRVESELQKYKLKNVALQDTLDAITGEFTRNDGAAVSLAGVQLSNIFPSPIECESASVIELVAPREPVVTSSIASTPRILTQTDFTHGTFIITEPGNYRLGENIHFEPNPRDDWLPRSDQAVNYPGSATKAGFSDKIGPYTLGFFAAIAVASDDVTIDLDGFTISQTEVYALQQRYFAIIELGNSPFIPNQGPANFGGSFVPARRCAIYGGTLGRSSHHGIHGNMGTDLQIRDLIIRDWEVAAIALNGFQRVHIDGVIAHMKRDIPVMAPYSQIRFIRQFVQLAMRDEVRAIQVASNKPTVLEFSKTHPHRSDERLDGRTILDNLDSAMRPVLERAKLGFPAGWKQDIFINHPKSAFLVNTEGKIDGTPYGLLIGMAGVQVHGFKTPTETQNRRSSDVFLRNVTVYDLHARVNEVVGLSVRSSPERDAKRVTQADYAGAIFVVGDDFGVTDDEGYYRENALSDAHAFLNMHTSAIKRISDRIANTDSLLTIPDDFMEAWVRQGSKTNMQLVTESDGKYKFACGFDDMRHVIKGLMGMRLEGTDRARIENVVFDEINNTSPASSHKYCGSHEYTINSRANTAHDDIAPTTFGFVVAATNDLQVRNCYVRELTSANGDIITWSTSRTESRRVQLDMSSVIDSMRNGPAPSDPSRIFPNKAVVRAFPFEFQFSMDNANGETLSFCVEKA